jgi:hypothetical protein
MTVEQAAQLLKALHEINDTFGWLIIVLFLFFFFKKMA